MEMANEPAKKRSLFHKRQKKDKDYSFARFPYLQQIKPRESVKFYSDYFTVDGYYCSILALRYEPFDVLFTHFWGVLLIPLRLEHDVQLIIFEQVSKMSKDWVDENEPKAEKYVEMKAGEESKNGTYRSRASVAKSDMDLGKIARELATGDTYLNVQHRLLVKAPTLKGLEKAIDTINDTYKEKFGVLSSVAYPGEQRREMQNLFMENKKKIGEGMYFTSTEYAGAYSLVTHGMEDPHGVYVGKMRAEVNDSAILFDINGYAHHSVVCFEQMDYSRGKMVAVADQWASKISQEALMNGHRVIHILLNNCDMNEVGPKFAGCTSVVDMNKGDVNPFEVFGSRQETLDLYSAHIEKLTLMFHLLLTAQMAMQETEWAIVSGLLSDILQQFYIDKRMWHPDAKNNLDKVRLVGIPHDQVPLLHDFNMYVAQRKAAAEERGQAQTIKALNIISLGISKMLGNDGDLFDVPTKSSFDNVRDNRRVIYDFSGLSRRTDGVAMAQLVNIMAFAVGTVKKDDVLILHGAENIVNSIHKYINKQLSALYQKGGRVVYVYNDMDEMLKDNDFCHIDRCDYIVTGKMTENQASTFTQVYGKELPDALKGELCNMSDDVAYIRRGFDNVIFETDLHLFPPERKKQDLVMLR